MTIIILILLIVALVLFDLAALHWGVDTTDRIESRAWERRHHWRGFMRIDHHNR